MSLETNPTPAQHYAYRPTLHVGLTTDMRGVTDETSLPACGAKDGFMARDRKKATCPDCKLAIFEAFLGPIPGEETPQR